MQRRHAARRHRRSARSAAGFAQAQAPAYPAKPVKVVVAFTAGGTTDILARAVAQKLSDSLKQPFVIDNKPGAGGNLGTEFVVRAPADGYTLIVNSVGPMAVNQTLYQEPALRPADRPRADRADRRRAERARRPTRRCRRSTFDEFIAYAKANPGKLNYGSTGIGTSSHLSSFMLSKRIGAETQHVPYKGADALERPARRPAAVHVRDDPVGDQHHQGRQPARARGQQRCKRSRSLPDVPTVAEKRLPRVLGRLVVRLLRAQGHAAGGDRHHQQGRQRGIAAVARGAAGPRRRRPGGRQRRSSSASSCSRNSRSGGRSSASPARRSSRLLSSR